MVLLTAEVGKTNDQGCFIWSSLFLFVPTLQILEELVFMEWKWSRSVLFDSLRPRELYSPWNSPGQNTVAVAFPFSRGSSHPGIEPKSHTLQADSLPAEPQGKPDVYGEYVLSINLQVMTCWDPPKQPNEECTVISSIYRWEDWGTPRLSNLPKVTEW